MPRGTRAVHGVEAPLTIHGTGNPGGDYAIMQESDWLAVECWCHACIVAVPYYEFRYMELTRSCGKFSCRGKHEPFGPPRLGYVLPPQVPHELAKWLTKHGVPKPRYPRHVTVRRRPPKPLPTHLAERRDRIEAAYRLSPKPLLIARALNLALHTVNNDIQWLRRHKRL